jgi:elongation factor P--(R)-beta-lysine ligase
MDNAKSLRKGMTETERRLWSRIRNNQLGEKFRRQHRILGYVADFACVEKQLIIELDGSQHFDQSEYDEKRTIAIEALGFRVVRFWNNDVLEHTDDVLDEIVRCLSIPPHPSPLPRLRRGRGSRSAISNDVVGVNQNARTNTSFSKTESFASDQSLLPRSAFGGEGWVRGNVAALRARAKLNTLIRQFFADRNVLEIETPILSVGGNTDPNIESFTTKFSGHVDAGAPRRYLRTSSEFPQKRLLAAGIGDCYELGRVFRNGEAGKRHNPEFTMLEWYRVGWDHDRLMDEVVELVAAALAQVEKSVIVQKYTYRRLFIAALQIDPFEADLSQLQAALGDVQIDGRDLTRDDWLDLLLTHRIQPEFPLDRITLIHDYPASQCALAKIRNDDPPVAERFELYLGTQELANGYRELSDAAEQRVRFERDNAIRRQRGAAEVPLDENLLAALAAGMPDCAGVALGVERLLMAMLGTDDIRGVLAFGFAQA